MNQLLAMRAFVRVVETSSFNRAADQLGMPRSTVSKLIIDLEKHLSVKLIYRTTRTLKVSIEGQDYYRNAVRLLSDIDTADNQVRQQKIKPSGPLKISSISHFADHYLIPKLSEFRDQYPDIKIILSSTDRTINLVESGVDCAIRAGNLHDTSVIARKIFDLPYITCAATEYLEQYGIPSSLEQLETEHQLISYFFADNDKAEPLKFIKGFEHHQITKFDYAACESNSIVQMLRAGLGIAQPLRYYVQSYFDSGELKPILLDWNRPALPVYVVYPPNKHKSTRLKVFVDWILQEFSEIQT